MHGEKKTKENHVEDMLCQEEVVWDTREVSNQDSKYNVSSSDMLLDPMNLVNVQSLEVEIVSMFNEANEWKMCLNSNTECENFLGKKEEALSDYRKAAKAGDWYASEWLIKNGYSYNE